MPKSNQKIISVQAAQFLQFLRNHKAIPGQEKIEQQKQNQSPQKKQIQWNLDMQSESVIEAQQLFENLKPDHFSENQKQITKQKKQSQPKSKNTNKKIEDIRLEEDKILQTKSILKKGKIQKQNSKNSQSQDSEPSQSEKIQHEQVKRKKVTFQDILPLNTQLEKKWKDPIENQRKGKFDKEEEKILSEALGKFLVMNDITIEQFEKILSLQEKSDKISKKTKIFALLSTVLPKRSPQSCYKYLKRNFNTLNRKGKWNDQEIDKLKILVEKYGRKWTLISKELKRSSENCYDKFRQLGDENMDERIKGIWKFEELVQFLKLIEKMAKIKFLEKSIDQELKNSDYHNLKEKEQVMNRKYNSKNFIFHNNTVIRPFINVKNFNKIDISQIGWSQISAKIKTRNIHDCRNKILQLLQIFFHSRPKEIDEKIVEFLIQKKYQNSNDINWRDWKEKDVTSQQAKNRFMILKKMVEGRSVKSFKVILLQLRQRLDKKIKEESGCKQKKHVIVNQDQNEQ